MDDSDTVVIAVRPQVVVDVLETLRFRPDHLVISLVATYSIESIAAATAPAVRVVRAIPLPSAANRASPTPIMPPDPKVRRLFDHVGATIETSDVRAFNAMSAVSGVMAGYLAAGDMIVEWLTNNGLTADQAETYVRQLVLGLSGTIADVSESSFDTLAKAHMTEGGLNEQFLNYVVNTAMKDVLWSGLDTLLERVERN